MVESVMRQAMGSWLKAECIDTGMFLLDIYGHTEEIYNCMLDDDRTALIKAGTWLNILLSNMEREGKIPPDKAAEIGRRAHNAITDYLGLPSESPKLFDTMMEINKLRLDIGTYAMERVVGCQIGKPGG